MIKIGDKVEYRPSKRDYPISERVGERGTVVHCKVCGGKKKQTCNDCVNSIAGREQGGAANWCYVLWDGGSWIQGVWIADLKVISIVDQIAEL